MRPLFIVPLALVAALALPACSDDGGVSVTLDEFSVGLHQSSAAAGDVALEVANEGSEDHQFIVIKTDLEPDALPLTPDGSVDEGGEGIEEVGRVDRIDPGGSSILNLKLEPGSYVFFCNIVETGEEEGEEGEFLSHFALGERTKFTIE